MVALGSLAGSFLCAKWNMAAESASKKKRSMGLGNYTLCNQKYELCGDAVMVSGPPATRVTSKRCLRVRVPLPTPYAPVAQSDRAPDYGSGTQVRVRVLPGVPHAGLAELAECGGFENRRAHKGSRGSNPLSCATCSGAPIGTRPGWKPGEIERSLKVRVLSAAPEYKRFVKRSGRQTERDRRFRN